MCTALRIPDLAVRLEEEEMPEVCVLSDRADTFLLGTRVGESGDDGAPAFLTRTFRPLRRPTDECNDRVSAAVLGLDSGVSASMNP